MQRIKLLIALLGFAATLFAADPFTGTWKMNAAKTKYKTGVPPKEQTVVIAVSGTDITMTGSGIGPDGSKIALSYSVPLGGGTGKVTSTAYDGVVGKLISATEREVSYTKGGKAVYTTHSQVSADGTSMTVTLKGTNPLGQIIDGVSFYDKQK